MDTPEAPWTGSGWREYSYGGFGEATHISTCMVTARNQASPIPHCQLGKLCRSGFYTV
jgi:hypothetical protein